MRTRCALYIATSAFLLGLFGGSLLALLGDEVSDGVDSRPQVIQDGTACDGVADRGTTPGSRPQR